jgi:hypothetical protein
VNYFNCETKNSLKALDFSILSLNNNIFCKFDEKFIVFFKNNTAFEEMNEQTLIKRLYLNPDPLENKLFVDNLFCFKLIKSLCRYKNYEDLSFQTKEMLAKILNNPKLNDNILKYIVKYLLDASPKKIFYLMKYYCFLNEKEENFDKKLSKMDKIHAKIWKLMDFYDFNKKYQKITTEKTIFFENFNEYHEILEEMDDYNYLWIYLGLKTKNYDFIRDIIIFNSKFEGGKLAKVVQKILILVNYEEKNPNFL